MRLILLAMLVLSALLPAQVAAQDASELGINSKRYIVIDGETGEVYAQKGARDEVPIASLTKIFTAVQALEMASPDTRITTTVHDLFGPDNTLMGFGPNETYTLEDLIYGMLLPSGNDAAYAIARHLGGWEEGEDPDAAVQRFMDLVNQRARDMGLEHTNLITPSGWGVPGHHSSAWDVAAMMQHALDYPLIEKAISTVTYTTSNGLLTIGNTNKLLNSYGALIGGKTGYDLDAGWCLVNVAAYGDQRMIAVTLDGVAPDDWYDDNRVLLEYGFDAEAELAEAAWTGDTVTWQNPAIAEIERGADSDVAFAGGRPAPETAMTDDLPDTVPAVVPDVPEGSVAVAVVALLALLGARAALAWTRWPLGRARPRAERPR